MQTRRKIKMDGKCVTVHCWTVDRLVNHSVETKYCHITLSITGLDDVVGPQKTQYASKILFAIFLLISFFHFPIPASALLRMSVRPSIRLIHIQSSGHSKNMANWLMLLVIVCGAIYDMELQKLHRNRTRVERDEERAICCDEESK